MQSPRFRRFSGWFAYCLCLFIPLLAGCGDFCLFCDGNGGGNGGNGNGSEEICNNVFPGVDKLEQVNLNNVIEEIANGTRNRNRLSLAVIPKGMSFEYGNLNLTANPGFVVLADQLASSIYVYDEPDQDQTVLLTGFDDVSAVALLHQKIGETTDADLLFFTVQSENTLYIYDLTGSEEPSPITNEDLAQVFQEPGGFFESPVAIAVSADSGEAVIFVLN